MILCKTKWGSQRLIRVWASAGSASLAWLTDTLLGHAAALKEVWPAAAGLAVALAAARGGTPTAAAAARLYAVMFAAMAGGEDGGLHRMVGWGPGVLDFTPMPSYVPLT